MLSLVSENKRKKKLVLKWKKNRQKKTWLTGKDKCNVKLKLLIKKEKENKVHQYIFKDNEGE